MLTSKSPPSEFQTSAGGVMIRVPAGSFTMGSPVSEDGHQFCEQQRKVTFANAFYLGKSPVTQAQYEAVTGINPTDHEKIRDAPVDSIPWEMANEYCQKLTTLDRAAGLLPDDWEYRLPTEAEWEYACRAGSSEPRHGPTQEVAWYYDNADNRPHAVGQKLPNAWGFQDMLGNVWEWCQDWFRVAHPAHSLRGGCYYNSARVCRSAHRWGWGSFRARYFGFRLLAARVGPFDFSPPLDDFPPQAQPPCIYDAMDANDFDLALRLITADPAAIDPVDDVPPPLQCCIYGGDNPEWIEWLLDHGADIEHREQDYGSTPLITAIVHRRPRIIRTLVQRGADTSRAMHIAQRGLAGDFEDDPSLDREGYREIVELLRELGMPPQ
jgi:hypothetical protein